MSETLYILRLGFVTRFRSFLLDYNQNTAQYDSKADTIQDQMPYQSKWRKSLEKKYMRLCSGHYNLRAHMHKLKLSDTPTCECGQDREDASHVLMHCSRYQQQREVMIDNIERLYIRHNTPFHERHITFPTLANPDHKSSLTRDAIKEEVVGFIAATNFKC